ncbi:MAG: SRPBCC family protein [Lacisediminimonas sp.]|nr:SRPBCC family protein [Lacisediminimonas sp.]
MELKKSFDTRFSPEQTWEGLSDIHLVASCLPGASITEQITADEYKGKLSVKVGPLAAGFDGLISIERDALERVALVTGKGADAKSSSRVTAKMRYQVTPGVDGGAHVEIVSDISLAGALAQFGKAAVMQEIANRMTNEFVRQFESRLAEQEAVAASADTAQAPDAGGATATAPAGPDTGPRPPVAAPQSAPSQLDAGKLLWVILKDRLAGFFKRIFK